MAPQPQVTPAQPPPSEEPAAEEEAADAEAAAPKKHHKTKKLHEKKDTDQAPASSGDKELDDSREALQAAKKQLKHLRKMKKQTSGFIASKASSSLQSGVEERSESSAHEGVQKDSPMLEGEAKSVEELTEKALGHTENSESAGLMAQKLLRKEV